MLTRPVKAALRYRMLDNLAGLATLFGIVIAIYLVQLVLALSAGPGSDEGYNVSAVEVAVAITLLVYGIVVPRYDIRYFTQNSLTRQDFFRVEQIAILLTSLAAAIVAELINLLAPLTTGRSGINYISLYEMMFGSYSIFGSLLCACLLGLACYQLGILIQGFYYRAAKPLMLVVSIGVPLLLFVGLPVFYDAPLVSALLGPLIRLLTAMIAAPLTWGLGLLAFALLFATAAWFFFRRAPLR